MLGNEPVAAYVFVADGSVHCIPMDAIQSFSEHQLEANKEDDGSDKENSPFNGGSFPTNDHPDAISDKKRNLLYLLSNLSLSNSELSGQDQPSRQRPVSCEFSGESISEIIDNHVSQTLYCPGNTINLKEELETDFERSKDILMRLFPDWADSSKIEVKQVTGGITNMLLKCTYAQKDRKLMRIYGEGTSLIIDRDREFILHLILNSIGLATSIDGRFGNSLVYGFISGRSLETEELPDKKYFPLIAQQLGHWHSKLQPEIIESGIKSLQEYRSVDGFSNVSTIWGLIHEWIKIVPVTPELVECFQKNCSGLKVNDSNLREVIAKEFAWLKSYLSHSKSPVVSCHCDLLSGNVIVPSEDDFNFNYKKLPPIEENPIQFIDFEYMLPAPRAFDIANHLSEWQGFDCNRDAIPEPSVDNQVLRKWVGAYLNDSASPQEVSDLIEEIKDYYGLPGFYWGIWAMIQGKLSSIDFNYSVYGISKLQEYWDWKKSIVN